MSGELRKPTARECEQCGRKERWDDSETVWKIVREDDRKLVGNPHCIHEWDINGTFNPLGGERE